MSVLALRARGVLMARSFGIVKAAQYARDWAPYLDTKGQRLVLSGLVMYMSKWDSAHPTLDQLAEYSGLSRRWVSTTLTQLEDRKVIAPLSDRSKGGRPTEWIIQPASNQEVQSSTSTRKSRVPGTSSEPGTGARQTRNWGASNQEVQSSTIESIESIEKQKCASHTFKESKVGRRVYRRCTTCGERDGSTVENIEEELSIEEKHLDGEVGDGESMEHISAGLDAIYEKERAMGRYT